MRLSIDDAVKTVLSFDNLVREGMTTSEQIGFLIDNHAQLDEDYSIGGEKRTVLLSDGRYHTFRPLSTLFDSSAFAWNIYRPENLVDLTIQQLATLARIHDSRSDIPVQYQTIVEATHILPRAARALFCAIQMRGFLWTEDRRIFANRYKQKYYLALTNGKPLPEYPSGFCKRRFYGKFSSSYASKLPQTLIDAIAADNPAQFSIMLTMSNRQLSKNLLLHLINAGAINILLGNFDAVARFLPIDTLTFYCASSLDQHLAVPLLKQIEKVIPGTLRNAQDIFGNNALWYLLYQEGNSADHTGRNYRVSSSESIEALLLEHGCNPNQANCLDLTYNSIRVAQKELNHFV